jgi:hypothetical protein
MAAAGNAATTGARGAAATGRFAGVAEPVAATKPSVTATPVTHPTMTRRSPRKSSMRAGENTRERAVQKPISGNRRTISGISLRDFATGFRYGFRRGISLRDFSAGFRCGISLQGFAAGFLCGISLRDAAVLRSDSRCASRVPTWVSISPLRDFAAGFRPRNGALPA